MDAMRLSDNTPVFLKRVTRDSREYEITKFFSTEDKKEYRASFNGKHNGYSVQELPWSSRRYDFLLFNQVETIYKGIEYAEV